MTVTKPAHIAMVPMHAWGHLRPVMHLAVQLLVVHPELHISLLLSPSCIPRCRKELASTMFDHLRRESGSSTPGGRAVLDRLQLLCVAEAVQEKKGDGEKNDFVMTDDAMKDGAALPELMSALFGKSGARLHGNQVNKFDFVGVSAVIYDVFCFTVPQAVDDACKQAGVGMVPTFMFFPSPASSVVNHFGKREHGGFVPYILDQVAEGQAGGKDLMETLGKASPECTALIRVNLHRKQIIEPTHGSTPHPAIRQPWRRTAFGDHGVRKKLPGLPEMTDFETHPGLGACQPPAVIFAGMLESYKAASDPRTTGFILTFCDEISKDSAESSELMGKPMFAVGMQYPEQVWQGEIEPPAENEKEARDVLSFLDRMEAKHGKNSVMYCSFGSAWFPINRLSLVETLLRTLLQADYPFVFAYATELFPVPEYLIDMIKGSENAMAVQVAPQMAVLHHPATGMFLSHCGGNSSSEAIVAGVPMIGMPFAADQGEYCHVLKQWGAVHDLKQAKTFLGDPSLFPKTLFDGTEYIGTDEAVEKEMTELWARLKGGYADELRGNMQKVKAVADKSRKEGESRRQMEGLSQYF